MKEFSQDAQWHEGSSRAPLRTRQRQTGDQVTISSRRLHFSLHPRYHDRPHRNPRSPTGPWLVNPTSVSLLDRLKVARPDDPDWNRLQAIYLPLIRRWLGRVPGLGDEAADLAQEVLVVVVPRDPPVRPAARGVVPGLAPAGHGEPGPELPQAAAPPARRRARPGRRVPRSAGRPERRPRPRVGPRPRPARRREAPGGRAARLQPRPPGRRSAGSPSTASRPRGWPRNWA